MAWRYELPDSEGWWWHRERYQDKPWCAPLIVEVRLKRGVLHMAWPTESDFETPPVQPPNSDWTFQWAKAEEPKEVPDGEAKQG